MSQDILATLQQYLSSDGKSINVPPQVSQVFGQAIGDAIQQLFSGGLQVNGVNFSLTGDSATATISGSGAAAPLLSQVQVTAIFTATSNDVTLVFTGSILSDLPISSAWPAALNFYPFNALTLSSGSMSLNVDPGAKTLDLAISPTVSLSGMQLGTGLIEVTYDGSEVGYLGGFIVSGTWSPFADFPVLSSLEIQGEFGAFLSTFKATDLSAFTGFPFVPDEVDAGLTVIAFIELANSLEKLSSFLPTGTNLQLTAIVPKDGGTSKASVSAELKEPTTTNAFVIDDFKLTWQSTSADSGTITMAVTSTVNISSTESLDISGKGKFTYGTTPSLSLELDLDAKGGWLHPFGIPNLTILEVAFGFTLSEEGISIQMAGVIEIGTGQTEPVYLTAGAGFLDFDVPDYVAAELSDKNPAALVTLAQLITDFIPSLNLTNFPLLNDISFADLQFWAVAAPVTILGKSYSPGIGASGTISFYGYELDFGFNLITSPSTAVQAKGVISYQGGPIVISGGGITWLTISDSTGTKGASACIDTSGSGYCSLASVPNAYFAINAKISLLGLISTSVVAAASKDVFEFDLALSAGSIFSNQLHVLFNPQSGGFAGSLDTDFSPPDIKLGPWGCIPSFTIPTPKISLCLALGTIMPSSPPCADGWMPTSAPYFHFDLHFSFVGIDFDISISLDINQVTNALNDFGSFITNWLLNNASVVLNFILSSAELLTRLLLNILTDVVDLVKQVATMVAQQLGMLFEDAYKLAGDIWDSIQDVCSVVTGNEAMSNNGTAAMVMAVTPGSIRPAFTSMPKVLADLTTSSKGNALLYHYYSNRDEMESLLRSNEGVRHTANAILARHRESAEYASGIYLPVVIDLIRSAAPSASADFQESAHAVVAGLEPYADKTYDQLLELLHTES